MKLTQYLPQLLLATVFASVPLTAAPLVAVLGAPSDPSWNDDVQAKLVATGLFAGVDLFNVESSGPTLTELNAYAAVLVYSDYAIPASVGDTLADYVDGGGRVVDAVFTSTPDFGIGGRWKTDGYALINAGIFGGTSATLGTADSSHPIMQGVNSFDGGDSSYRDTGSPKPGTTIIATWSDGTPLVITGTISGNLRVTLNFYPPSSDSRSDFWNPSTDGARLMANALLYASGETSEVPEPATYALIGAGLILFHRCRR